jgi:hypothetical protein
MQTSILVAVGFSTAAAMLAHGGADAGGSEEI